MILRITFFFFFFLFPIFRLNGEKLDNEKRHCPSSNNNSYNSFMKKHDFFDKYYLWSNWLEYYLHMEAKEKQNVIWHLGYDLYIHVCIYTHTKIRFWDSIWEKIISWNTDLHREKLRKWVEERTCHFTSPLPCLFHERVNLYKCFYEGNTEKHVFWMEG